MLKINNLCEHVAHFTHSSVRAYDNDNNIICKAEGIKDTQDIFDCDKEFESYLLNMGTTQKPVQYTEQDSILYYIIKGADITYVMGPCCCQHDTKTAAKQLIINHYLDGSQIFRLSYSNIEMVCECALMLFHSVSDKQMQIQELVSSNFNTQEFSKVIDKKIMEVYKAYKDDNIVHNPYSQERHEQDSIRNGDVEELKKALSQVYVGQVGKMAKDEVRSAKNISIAVLALSARSAIEGGLLPEIAFSMSDAYAMRFEELTSLPEIEALLRNAEYQFATVVREIKQKKRSNPIVTSCKDYIIKNLNKKIVLTELADKLRVNSSYLSDLFSKQEGITISEYVLKSKVEASMRQLVFTDEPYGTIAFSYSFSSQSHYGKTFKKYTGMTPKEYRKLNKITDNI